MNANVLVVCCLAALVRVSAAGLVNEEVKRTVDLSTHLAKITTDIVLSNQGHSAVQSFILSVEPDLAPHLAYIGASVMFGFFKRSQRYDQPVSFSMLAINQWTESFHIAE